MSSSIQNDPSSNPRWTQYLEITQAVAVPSVAIIPVFYGFVAKSAQQLGGPIPKMTIVETLKGGVKAAPTIGIIVGTQMSVQKIAERALMKKAENKDKPTLISMIMSSIMVGGLSAYPLAVFNGQTMGRSVTESLKSLSAKQTAAIITRETSFIFALRISVPVSEAMKRRKNNKAMEYLAVFVSGVIGSFVGHPADVALTRWQKGKEITHVRQLAWGCGTRGFAVGGFTVLYKMIDDVINFYRK